MYVYFPTLYTGWINELMSWKPFIPLGRLTYMAYLVHPIVMLSYYMSRRQLTYFNNYEVVGSCKLSICFMVCLFDLILYISVISFSVMSGLPGLNQY